MKLDNFKNLYTLSNTKLLQMVSKMPATSGVYIFKYGKEILYIGKATSLKDRVRSYFSKDLIKMRGMLLVDMVAKANTVDFVKTDSVLEAIILEANLIKKYQPKYNTKEKDNKSFNYVCITKEEIPKVLVVRGRNLKKDNYKIFFGPFTNGMQLREALKIIRKIFPFFDTQSIKKQNIEFYRQIGLIPKIDTKQNFSSFALLREYKNNIKNLILFFQGKKKKILQNLKKEMGEYAKCHEFEKANEIKKKIFALNHINDVALIKEDSIALQNHKNIALRNSQSGLKKQALSLYSADSSEQHFFDPVLFNRIEAYDVAHMSGKNIVGVMTVIENGEPEKNEYKKFIIKSVKNSNDPASLQEILERRLAHKDWRYPNIIVVDGNNIQKNIAQKVLKDFNLDIPVVAVTKDRYHKPKALIGSKNIIEKQRKSILLANAEAHRFALSFHRQRRSKSFI